MKDPHPNDDDESKHKVWHDLVPADIAKFNDHILSIQFQQFLELDAVTTEGQMKVAEWYRVGKLWGAKKNTTTLT
jgi:hypothetical protein